MYREAPTLYSHKILSVLLEQTFTIPLNQLFSCLDENKQRKFFMRNPHSLWNLYLATRIYEVPMINQGSAELGISTEHVTCTDGTGKLPRISIRCFSQSRTLTLEAKVCVLWLSFFLFFSLFFSIFCLQKPLDQVLVQLLRFRLNTSC